MQSFPVLPLGVTCWDGNVSKHDQGRVHKVIHRASRIVGRQITSSICIEGKCYIKLVNYSKTPQCRTLFSKTPHTPSMSNFILQDPSHPLHVELYSPRPLTPPPCRTLFSKTPHTPSMSNFFLGSVTEAAYVYSITSRQTATNIIFYLLLFQFLTLNNP